MPTGPIEIYEPEKSEEELVLEEISVALFSASVEERFAFFMATLAITGTPRDIRYLDYNRDGLVGSDDRAQLLAARGQSVLGWYYYNNLKGPADWRVILQRYVAPVTP